MGKNSPQGSRNTRATRKGISRGSALVEFIILIPLLSLLLGGVYEVSRAIHQYHLISNIAYQSTRAGAQMSPNSLAKGCWTSQQMSFEWLESNQQLEDYEALYLILRRAEYLLNFYSSELSISCQAGHYCDFAGSLPEISAEVVAPDASGASLCGKAEDGKNTFSVRIRGKYQPAILPMIKIPFTIHSTGYMLANNQTFSTPTRPIEKCVPRYSPPI